MRFRPIAVLLDLAALAATAHAATTEGLIGHWPFDAGTGRVARDASGCGNDGTIHGAAFVKDGRESALRFDGSDDFVDCGNAAGLAPTRAVTVRAWVLPHVRPGGETGIVVKGTIDAFGLTFYRDSRCWWYIAGGANHCKASVGVGGWHQVTGTYDGSAMRLYVDGRPKDSRRLGVPIPPGGNLLIGKQASGNTFFSGIIDEVQVYDRALSDAEILSRYEAEAAVLLVHRPTITGGFVLRARDFRVRVGDTGGTQVEVGSDVYFVESSYSYPGKTIGRNHFSEGDFTSEPDWRPKVSEAGEDAVTVAAAGAFYSVTRIIRRDGDRIRVADTLTNTGADNVGVIVNNTLIGADGILDHFPEAGGASAENPTLLLSKASSSLGVVAEDDISRVQYIGSVSTNTAHFGVRHFALGPGKRYTFRWTLYPRADRADYHAFVARIRDAWHVNFPVQGPFMFFDAASPLVRDPQRLRAYLRWKKIKIAGLSPWLDYDPGSLDHVLTRDEYTATMRPVIRALKQADPEILCIGCIETDWATIDPKQVAGGDQLPMHRGGHTGRAELTPEQTAIIDAAGLPWQDSYKRKADGHLVLELYRRGGKAQTAIWVYPEVGNHQYAFLLEQVKFLLDEVGMDGFYIDEFSQAWRDSERTYNKRWNGTTWDGISADIDAVTGRITGKYVDCSLAGIQARVNLCRYALDRGKVVVANTYSTSAAEQPLAVYRFAETVWYFDPMQWPAGVKPPLVPALCRSHLGSPIGLGIHQDAAKQDYAERIMKGVMTYLRHGMVYYHYVVPDPPMTGAGRGGFGPINHMFPITPTRFGDGFLEGKERILTCVSGHFVWPHAARPRILLFDLTGRPVAHTMEAHPSGRRWALEIKLADWKQIAVVEARP